MHDPMSDAHRASMVGVGNPHGMIPIGGGPGVISVTNPHGLMGVAETHPSSDVMLPVTDQHGIMQHFDHLEPPQSFDDHFHDRCGPEPLKDMGPQSRKGGMHEAEEEVGTDFAKDSDPAVLYGTDADSLLVGGDSAPPLKEQDLHVDCPPVSKRARLMDDAPSGISGHLDDAHVLRGSL